MREALTAAYYTLDKRCPFCNEPISYEKRENIYCNSTCAASAYRSKTSRLKGTCHRCNCAISSQNTECTPCWYTRISAGGAGAGEGRRPKSMLDDMKTDASRKRVLIYESGRRCAVCSLEEWQGEKIPIELDHIDGDCFNNSRENLRLLCPNCHAQTPTYRGKNIGRGKRPKENNWRPNRGKIQSPHSELN